MLKRIGEAGQASRNLCGRGRRGWSRRLVGCGAWLGYALVGGWALAGEPGGPVSQSRQVAPAVPPVVPVDPPRPVTGPAIPPRSSPFDPSYIRLPRLADTPLADCPDNEVGRTPPGGKAPQFAPSPSPKDLEEYSKFVDQFIDPRNTFEILAGRTRLLILKEPPRRIQVGNPAIVEAETLGPKELSLLGRDLGTTDLTLWFSDPRDRTKDVILSYVVRVIPDPEAKSRLERIYKALETEINQTFCDSSVCLTLVGDKLVVSGQAFDIAQAAQIMRIIRDNAPGGRSGGGGGGGNRRGGAGGGYTPDLFVAAGPGLNVLDREALRQYLAEEDPNVINLMRIPGEQQVMLRVQVAEVSRSAARSIGIDFSITIGNGIQVFQQTTAGLLGGGGGGGAGGAGGAGQGAGGGGNLPILLDNGQIQLAINALVARSYARTWAEPNLVTLNGVPASFQAGGNFPVPVIATTGFAGQGAIGGVQFVPFGVQLSFTPTITCKDRIRLQVGATVSARDEAGGTNISGSQVPGLTTRNFQTTVELREGQTLAVAGLIQTNLGANSTRVPFWGDIPLIGRFAASDRISAGEQELVILITPELVHPLESKEIPPLPGSDIFEPGDLEFYLGHRLESRRSYDYRSQVRNDLCRQKRYKQCEDIYISGPHGYTVHP